MIKKKILVIDDEEPVRKWVVAILAAEGYDCRESGDGVLGYSVAESFMPDVILSDINMPQASGYDVFERLSQNPKTASIPFIFLTGSDMPEDVRKGMNFGADDYLTKPIAAADLLASVHARLNKKQQQEQQIQIKVQHVRDALVHENYYDAVTHLPNRQFLIKQFQGLNRADLQKVPLAIVSIGLDSLIHITEAFGARGAQIVLHVANDRIKQCLNPEDLLYRGEYDSFNVLIWNVSDQQKIEMQMQAIIQSFKDPVPIADHPCRIKVTIGWTIYDPNSDEPLETFLNHAATARQKAFNDSSQAFQKYYPEMQKFVVDRLMLENYLYKALENDEFRLVYQPQVNVATGQVKAVEALIRWHSSKLGVVNPLQFIPIAEKTGLILSIGKWVIDESCRQWRRWRDQGLDLKMAVNISGRQLRDGDLPRQVAEAMLASKIPQGALELEITESLLIKDVDNTIDQMKALKQQGVTIAIDDFGTGYSSLAILKKLPFDALKIDRSFITDIEVQASNIEIVETIIKMAQTLNLKTIAEGVETPEQLNCLKRLHCEEFQGFLFSRPKPESEMTLFLAENLMGKS